jgi:hypothetical protein
MILKISPNALLSVTKKNVNDVTFLSNCIILIRIKAIIFTPVYKIRIDFFKNRLGLS